MERAVRYPKFFIGLVADEQTVAQYTTTLDVVDKVAPGLYVPGIRKPHITLFYGTNLGEEELDAVYSLAVTMDEQLKDEKIFLSGYKFGLSRSGRISMAYAPVSNPGPLREAHYYLKSELVSHIDPSFIWAFNPHMTWFRMPKELCAQQPFYENKDAVESLLDAQRWRFNSSGVFVLAKDMTRAVGDRLTLVEPSNVSNFGEYAERFNQVLAKAS